MEAVIALILPDGYAPPHDVNLKELATNRRALAWLAALLVVGAAAALIPPLSVPAGVAILILTLSFPSTRRLRAPFFVLVALSAAGTLVGLVRFALSNAMLGIVETGQSITATTALSKGAAARRSSARMESRIMESALG